MSEIFPDDPWRRIIAYAVLDRLGDRASYFDIPGVVNTIVDRLGFVDMDEIDPAVFDEILDQNRKPM